MTFSWVRAGKVLIARTNDVVLRMGHEYPTKAHWRTLELLSDRGWQMLRKEVVRDWGHPVRNEDDVVAELKVYAEFLYGNDPQSCGYPEDDTVRLVYADYLDENGQPDRLSAVTILGRTWCPPEEDRHDRQAVRGLSDASRSRDHTPERAASGEARR